VRKTYCDSSTQAYLLYLILHQYLFQIVTHLTKFLYINLFILLNFVPKVMSKVGDYTVRICVFILKPHHTYCYIFRYVGQSRFHLIVFKVMSASESSSRFLNRVLTRAPITNAPLTHSFFTLTKYQCEASHLVTFFISFCLIYLMKLLIVI